MQWTTLADGTRRLEAGAYPVPQSEVLDTVFMATALEEARRLLVKWRAGLTPDTDDLDAIEEILRRDEILTTETER